MLTNEKKRDNARSHSGVRVVSDNGHVVIGVHIVQGVRIVQGYHAIVSNSDFSNFGPNFILVPNSEFVSCDLNLTVGDDLLSLSVHKSPNLCLFGV